MKEQELLKANEIKKEIDELRDFIWSAEKVWTGKIIKKEVKYIFKANPYGALKSKEFEMKTEIKNKVLDTLREHLNDLIKKLENI